MTKLINEEEPKPRQDGLDEVSLRETEALHAISLSKGNTRTAKAIVEAIATMNQRATNTLDDDDEAEQAEIYRE